MLTSARPMNIGSDHHSDLPEHLLLVIAELTDVITEENTVMAEGMPAAVVATVDRKLELSDTYEELYAELADNRAEILAQDPEFATKLMEAVLLLREVTAENLTRLDAAMTASKRRVEAVMAAMRSAARESAPYSAKGDVPLNARLAAFGKDYHA
ncbi:MAG: flagellar protein FlgN [Bacteroidota bacterium]